MLDKDRIYEIFSEYVSIEYDLRCTIKTIDVYEEYCAYGGKNEIKDAIHTIKNLLTKLQVEFSDANEKLDRELIEAE